ncbi:MAG: FixH family protein [Ignavibacteria bacterium]
MKISWGIIIAILYSGFVLLVLVMVMFSFTQRVDLVTDNYYEKELRYQEQIDKINRTNQLSEKLDFHVDNRIVSIKFPNKLDPDPDNLIHFYRPSNSSYDKIVKIVTDSSNFQKIKLNREKFSKGFWRVRINWVSGGFSYYTEKEFFLE